MSDDSGRGYPGDDPFVDPDDPESVARAERRREREAKRASKRGKQAAKAPAPTPPPETPPAAPRTPEQEFWDEPAEPAAPPSPQPPAAEQAQDDPPAADPAKAKSGRRRLLGRRRNKAAAAGAAASEARAAASGAGATGESGGSRAGAAADRPTGETSVPEPSAGQASDVRPTAGAPAAKAPPGAGGESPTTERPPAKSPSPPTEERAAVEPVGSSTVEQPMPKEPGQPDDQQPPAAGPPTTESRLAADGPGSEAAAGPPTGESRLADDEHSSGGAAGPPTTESQLAEDEPSAGAAAGPPTGESPLPDGDPASEAPLAGPTSETPRPDPGLETADSARPDPNRPASAAAPGDAGPATREHRAPVPIPVDQTGAGDWEPPPPRDDDWFDTGEHDFHEDGDPTMAGAARTGRRHGDDGGNRGPLRRIFGHPFLIILALIVIFVLILLNGLFQPFHGDGHGRVAVKIPKGSSVGEVGDLLEKKGVISGGTLFVSGSTMFQARVTLAGKRSDILSGRFAMKQDMSYGDAIDELTKEPSKATAAGVVTVTIPEGYTRVQAARLAKEDGLRGSYMKATRRSKYLNPAKYGGKGAKNLEGFLFPDTWELKSHSPVANLVQLQLQDFRKKIKHVNMKYARSKNLTVFDVLTIASIIEHEAGTADQRKLVAAVVYNRLREGMTLGSDATVRFATGNFEKPLTQSQLESNSPYNTRVHPGLPPGPISNPGLAAINAAAHPARKNYLFFVTSPDCKTLNFSATEAEFEEDVQRYENSKCTE